MPIPLLDLKSQYAVIRDEIQAAVLEVLDSQYFILGPQVAECERAVAAYCQAEHGVGVSSGSDALLICLMAEQIGPGDEVITTPYTFFATVGAIARVGATPVFVDIDPVSYNLDPAQIEARITSRTRAIIPVHLFGQCASMGPILELARRHGLVVVEDAAQAIGAQWQGRPAGSMGDYGCLSFFPSKNLGCAGDGGMVTTKDAERAERLRILRAHGSRPKYHHRMIGGNFRLDALQAAIVRVKLKYLDQWTAARQANARHYRQLFATTGLVENGALILPEDAAEDAGRSEAPTASRSRSIYNQFVLRVARRDDLQAYLKSAGIATEVYYPGPMHRQPCFDYLGYAEGDLPHSERAARETLAIPVYPELTADQRCEIVDTIVRFYQEHETQNRE